MADTPDEEITPELIQNFINGFDSTRGWKQVGELSRVPGETKDEPIYSDAPLNTIVSGYRPVPYDSGARVITVTNPGATTRAGSTTQITIQRNGADVNGQPGGKWAVTKPPDDTTAPPVASTTVPKSAAQVEAEGKEAVAKAEKARLDAEKAGKQQSTDEQQQQYNWEQHGMWMTHDEFAKFSQNQDANSRAEAAASAARAQQTWANNNVEKNAVIAARVQEVHDHPEKEQTDTDGSTYTVQWNPDTHAYVRPAGLANAPPEGKFFGGYNDPHSPTVTVYDKNGKVISSGPNPIFVADKPALVTPDTVSRTIQEYVQDPVTGKYSLQERPNTNRLTVSKAIMEVLNPSLAKAMASGDLSLEEAKTYLTQASDKTKNEISAAQTANSAANTDLDALNAAGATGASLLTNRAKNASDTLGGFTSAIGSNKNIGLGSDPGPNFGANLVQGISDWTANMAGGQGVIDNATKAVAALNPDDPHTAPNHNTLLQMQQLMGGLVPGYVHPDVQKLTQTGMTGNQPQPGQPQPDVAPQVPSWVRGDNANTTGANINPLTGLAYPGMAGTVNPGDRNYYGLPTAAEAAHAPGGSMFRPYKPPTQVPEFNLDPMARGALAG